MAALSVSGLPTDAFAFEGFLPRKRTARKRTLAALADEPRTLVLLETPHRLAESLRDAAEILGADRRAFLARELTKLHEELVHATLGELAEKFGGEAARGEVTLVVEGATAKTGASSSEDVVARVNELVAQGRDERDALRLVAREAGLTRRDVYRAVKISRSSTEEE
jgi:16S rRNA (cytidine1402-2'-O)-methyltransferase